MVTQTYDAALKPAGMKATQFTLLATLNGLGTLPLTQLAKALGMERTTLTRNLKPLANQGWVAIEEQDDRRVRHIVLTEAGAKALEAARPHWQRAQQSLVDHMGDDNWSTLVNGLDLATAATRGS